jgi:hypothetical protein
MNSRALSHALSHAIAHTQLTRALTRRTFYHTLAHSITHSITHSIAHSITHTPPNTLHHTLFKLTRSHAPSHTLYNASPDAPSLALSKNTHTHTHTFKDSKIFSLIYGALSRTLNFSCSVTLPHTATLTLLTHALTDSLARSHRRLLQMRSQTISLLTHSHTP